MVEEEDQRFELSHLLALEVLPFLKLLFRKFVIPCHSDLEDDLCLSHVVAMFEHLCAQYADQVMLQIQYSLLVSSVQKMIWSKILLFLESIWSFF